MEHDGGPADQVLDALVAGISGVLGDDLVAVWLYGSSVTGDFEVGVSDIDLVAVTTAGIDADDLAGLGRMHDDLVVRYGDWRNRLVRSARRWKLRLGSELRCPSGDGSSTPPSIPGDPAG